MRMAVVSLLLLATLPVRADTPLRPAAETPPAEVTPAAPVTSRLTITVKGLEARVGHLLVTVYTDEASWLDKTRAVVSRSIPVETEGDQVVVLEGLTPGPIAVAVHHDANDNGELDMRWFPFPRPAERLGMSRDPRSSFGPPDFEDAVYELEAGEQTLEINLW